MNKSIYILCVICTLYINLSCRQTNNPVDRYLHDSQADYADSVIFDVGLTKDYRRIRVVVDSLEQAGCISELNANRWRGVAYYREGKYRMAELYYRKALDCEVKTYQEQVSYNKAARRLSELLMVRGDYEGSLSVAMPAVAKMEESGIGSDIDHAILLNNIGCCQLNLGQNEKANKSFLTARDYYANRWQTDSTGRGFQEAVIGTIYTSMAYINMGRYAESIYWIDRTEMLLGMYRQKPVTSSEYFDEYQGRIEIMRAVALQGLGKTGEAAEAYQRFLETDYSKTGPGRINSNDYLVAAQRYSEAAENYRYLDKAMADWGTEITLDNIQLYMVPKYRANYEAGYKDSANLVARLIINALDSAIQMQKKSSSEELKVIYQVNEKENVIFEQATELLRQKVIYYLIISILIIVSLIIYAVYRNRQAKILSEKNSMISKANEHIEELSRMKTELIQKIMLQKEDFDMSEKHYDVFISYSRANLEIVKAIKKDIEESTNARCWMDLEGIESGAPRFTESIIEGIEQCKVFLFMRTSQSQNSKYALLELNYATEQSQKHVVIVNIDDSDMTKEFKFMYGLTDTIDWEKEPQWEKLLRDIKKWR